MRIRLLLLMACFALAGTANAQNPIIQTALDDVRIDSMMLWVSELSGEVPTLINGNLETLASRHKTNPGNALSQTYLMQKFAQLGYVPIEHSFSATGKNILVYKPGDGTTDGMVVLCAHYDAMSSNLAIAPAADDDGSGVCAVLEAARVLHDVDFVHPILFALWDEEEQGKVGSIAYAADASADDSAFYAVVNLDAIAYDGDGDTKARVHTRPIANSFAISDTVFAVRDDYSIDIDLILTNPGATYSDHASFWSEGIGAVLLIEEFSSDGNPHYHTPTDRVEYFDVPYYEKMAKLGIASAAALAVPLGSTGLADRAAASSARIYAYPNPCSFDSGLWLDLPRGAQASLRIFDALGHEVAVLHNGQLPAGQSGFTVPLASLPAGSYVVRASISGMEPVSVRLVRLP